MEPEETQVEVETKKSVFTEVTPFSKYLAMVLFVLLPFIGGWIGYNYAPEKVVEVETVVIKEGAVQTDNNIINHESEDVVQISGELIIPKVGDVHGPFTVSEVHFVEQIEGWGLRHSIVYEGSEVLLEGTIYPDSDLKNWGYEGTFIPDSKSLDVVPIYAEEYRKDNFFVKFSSNTTNLTLNSLDQFEAGDEVIIFVDKVHLINDAKAVNDSLSIVDIQKK